MSETLSLAHPGSPGPRWHYLLAAGVAAVVVFWNLGGTALDDHECKLALTARSMAHGDGGSWLRDGGKMYTVPRRTALNRWMVPVENGEPRLVKTPLPYWAAAGVGLAYRALGGEGQMINDLTARIPSAVAAVMLVCITLAMGRRMMPPRPALLGAIMLATSIGFQKWGRNARPEMLLCMLMTAAMACFYMGLEARNRRGRTAWMMAFWVIMGLANLAKEFVPLLLAWPLVAYVLWRQSVESGSEDAPSAPRPDGAPIEHRAVEGVWDWIRGRRIRGMIFLTLLCMAGYVAVIMILKPASETVSYALMAVALGWPLVWYAWRTRGWAGAMGRLLPTAVPGAIVMAALFVPWMLYMMRLFPGVAEETFAHQTTERAGGVAGWKFQGPEIYLISLATITLPWIAFLPGALSVGLMRRFSQHRRGLVYLLLWSVGIFVIFMEAAGKREHYILPMLPAVCLLMGYVTDDVFFGHAWITRGMAKLLAVAYAIVGVLAVTVMGGLWYISAHAAKWLPNPVPARPAWWVGPFESIERAGPQWPVLMWACLAAAVLLVTGAALAWRGRFRPIAGLIAAAFAIVYVGNWTYASRWDVRGQIADFMREVRGRVERAEGPDFKLWRWGDPQSKEPFYLERNIEPVQWRFVCRHWGEEGYELGNDPEFHRWMADTQNAPWIMGYIGDKHVLAGYGYAVDMDRQFNEQLRTHFALFRRTARAGTPR
ncbi:MAG: glycosyltransferase family 39 protein [Phycisphaerae bacterium]